ncbi:hypothetical protein [Zhaonella formicivorans]|uniref:hypothetical protein n=1 Tax=Zhaonella formicivorans TaxID=2528593 RepID=UPI001D105D14|nr:hypothetical protein [Zhaonella formicivorans]
MFPSKIGMEVVKLEQMRDAEIERVKSLYREKLRGLQSICPHAYDNGVSAVKEVRHGFNLYESRCDICGKRLG